MTPPSSRHVPGARDRGGVIFGFAVAVAALVLAAIAFKIQVRPADILFGPRLFPLAIMIGLAALGIAAAVATWRRPPPPSDESAEEDEGPIDWRAVAWIMGGLAAFGVLVESAGFVVAAAVLFVAVARGFGSPRLLRDIVLAFLIAGTVFVVFVYGLGLDLPGPALPFGKG